jgi:hypothetical protein
MRIDKEVAQTCSFRVKGWCGSGAPPAEMACAA